MNTFFVQTPVQSVKGQISLHYSFSDSLLLDDRWENEILEAACIIRQAPAILIVAGAGINYFCESFAEKAIEKEWEWTVDYQITEDRKGSGKPILLLPN